LSDAASTYDRLIALRMIVPFSEIPAESLEGYWAHWKARGEQHLEAFRILAKEYEGLELGEAVLRLPDGSHWVSAGALLDLDIYDEVPNTDNRWLQQLHRVLVQHKEHRNHFGPLLPQVFLNAATLDVRHAFCVDCGVWMSFLENSQV
jgi:hypothetical protein